MPALLSISSSTLAALMPTSGALLTVSRSSTGFGKRPRFRPRPGCPGQSARIFASVASSLSVRSSCTHTCRRPAWSTITCSTAIAGPNWPDGRAFVRLPAVVGRVSGLDGHEAAGGPVTHLAAGAQFGLDADDAALVDTGDPGLQMQRAV